MNTINSPDISDKLLSGDGCPWSRNFRGTKAQRTMDVATFRQYAERQGYDADSAEEAMNEFVVRHEGKRETIIDPYRCVANFVRPAMGRKARPKDSVWLVPEEAFQQPRAAS